MKIYKSYFLFCSLTVLFFIFSGLLVSCSKTNYSLLSSASIHSVTGKPDYSDLNFWAAHPWKKDPSDSVPEPLRPSFRGDSSVDVFFIHPTTLTAKDDPRWNADINDAELNAKTDYTTILYQASVFNDRCRVFAPRYRQAHIRSFFIPDSLSEKYFDLAYEDVRAAFVYYLEHFNNGRPIIIASHSQGTKHAGRLLKEFFENKPLQNKLVCAYIIGLPVPEKYFSSLAPCKDSTSTGCFVTWRTFKSGYDGGDLVTKETEKMVVINPLTWTADSAYISSVHNKGGVLKKYNTIVPKVVSAQVHRNILWTSKPDVPGKILLTQKNYHVGDINLFYMNIRENIATRIAAFLKK
jgi:hypothetical protein